MLVCTVQALAVHTIRYLNKVARTKCLSFNYAVPPNCEQGNPLGKSGCNRNQPLWLLRCQEFHLAGVGQTDYIVYDNGVLELFLYVLNKWFFIPRLHKLNLSTIPPRGIDPGTGPRAGCPGWRPWVGQQKVTQTQTKGSIPNIKWVSWSFHTWKHVFTAAAINF